jgi:hypothetical protein
MKIELSKERQEKVNQLKQALTEYHNTILECIDKGIDVEPIRNVYNIILDKLIHARTK